MRYVDDLLSPGLPKGTNFNQLIKGDVNGNNNNTTIYPTPILNRDVKYVDNPMEGSLERHGF
jgi:hypothetical protein